MIEDLSRSIQLNVPQAPAQPSDDQAQVYRQAMSRKASQGTVMPLRDGSKLITNLQSMEPPKRQPQPASIRVDELPFEAEPSPIISSKKIRLNKLMGKLNKSLEDFFLKDGPEESSYVDDFSMLKHYNK